jgi:hypothetical protein
MGTRVGLFSEENGSLTNFWYDVWTVGCGRVVIALYPADEEPIESRKYVRCGVVKLLMRGPAHRDVALSPLVKDEIH